MFCSPSCFTIFWFAGGEMMSWAPVYLDHTKSRLEKQIFQDFNLSVSKVLCMFILFWILWTVKPVIHMSTATPSLDFTSIILFHVAFLRSSLPIGWKCRPIHHGEQTNPEKSDNTQQWRRAWRTRRRIFELHGGTKHHVHSKRERGRQSWSCQCTGFLAEKVNMYAVINRRVK